MRLAACFFMFFLLAVPSFGQFLAEKEQVKSFQGFFDFHYAEKEGKIFLEVERLNEPFLFVHALRTGLGSNDIGLDRTQLGGESLVYFEKAGDKLFLIESNQGYRATSRNELERRSVTEAFARSVLYGFEIAETEGTTYLIDLTPFLLQDRHGVIKRLKEGGDGTFKVDKSRSAVWMERTASFPQNSEFEALITYVGEPKGNRLRTVAPDPTSFSLVQHFGFVQLPDPGFEPRSFDPRSGSFPLEYMDFSTEVWKPVKKRLLTRHRLKKIDPAADVSEAVEPIVYYLDPGTPEPVRSALLEGGRWWNQAFEAIGYRNAFQVKMLPEDADPLDVRYNVIQWLHRSTRGWSYGANITDPRTGEIIKGHVNLGSLRIRQDFTIAQALMNAPFAPGKTEPHKPMLEMALARIRQLSAHEIGHTLGFAHNYAASSFGRASVMDYPHPMLAVRDGRIDFSNAYDTGIGAWDKVSVAYAYGDIPEGRQAGTYLNELLRSAYDAGMRFITDADARPRGSTHPYAHLWDNGADPVTELQNVLEVRALAMDNFSTDNVPSGSPLSVLEDVFVPLYFYHRYQTEAVVKLIGGMDYDYLVKDAPGEQASFIDREQQQRALESTLELLTPDRLAIPERVLGLFPPRAFGYPRTRESFKSRSGLAFDPLAAAETAADMVLQLLLNRDRLNRLVVQRAVNPDNMGADDLIKQLIAVVYKEGQRDGYREEIARTIGFLTLHRLLGVLADKDIRPQLKAVVNTRLIELTKSFDRKDPYHQQLLKAMARFEKDRDEFRPLKTATIPDGSPIGTDCMFYHR